jgi:hypothetical protein
MIINDLTVYKQMDMSEMSAVHGGEGLELGIGTVCINVGATLDAAAKSGGAGGVIVAAAGILGSGIKPC